MAAVFTKLKLSGSTVGKQIKVVATSTPGTTIHATGTSATSIDEIWVYASNSDTTDRKLTLEWGGVTDPDDLIEVYIPPEAGLVPVALRLPLKNSLVVKAFASVADVVLLTGGATRIA